MEHTDARTRLESSVRRSLQRFMLIMTIVSFVLEFGLGVYFYFTDTLDQTVPHYLLIRVMLPCSINIALYLLMFFVNRSPKANDDIKNRTCTTAFLMFSGELSIIHSYFVPLWMLSFFILMFAGIFHDPIFHKVQAVMCVFFVVAAGSAHIVDYPEEMEQSLESIVVCVVVGIAICYLSIKLERFSSDELLINMEITENSIKYKAGYEFDALTGVYSRGHLEEEANKVFSMTNNYAHIGVAMLDIDNFKAVNDTYGHDNGDVVLKKLGEYLLRFNTRESFCGRYGGEEFVIVFRNADKVEDIYELDNIRKLFESTKFSFRDEPVTISIGYHIGRSDSSWESELKKADDALYESKANGKNRITVKD